MGGAGGGQFYGIGIGLLVAFAIIILRNSRPRRLRLEAMWIRPAVILGLVALSLFALPLPTDPLSLAVIALALAVGAGLGWLRGSLMRIEVHPETHDISARASPVAMMFILAILGLRMFLRTEAMTTPIAGLSPVVITDGLLVLAGGMLTVANLEMWLRARRLLGEAQAAKATPGDPTIMT
jgi:hypothetical protein